MVKAFIYSISARWRVIALIVLAYWKSDLKYHYIIEHLPVVIMNTKENLK